MDGELDVEQLKLDINNILFMNLHKATTIGQLEKLALGILEETTELYNNVKYEAEKQ